LRGYISETVQDRK